jgi:hypothetical protein
MDINVCRKTEFKRRLQRCRWEDNTKINLKKCEGVDWVHLAQNRVQLWVVVNTVMKLRTP